MAKKASVKYRSLRSNLVHLPLSLYASLAQQQARPQSLILHLSPTSNTYSSRRPAQSAYLGWSGLAAASSLALAGLGGSNQGLETIEIDPEVSMGLGWAEGTIVEISVIHSPTKAISVSVTPLTSDDWEILEQHASFLENNLLGQLRAAHSGQTLEVWVMGRTKIRIRVDQTDPPTSASSAVLVNPDTEIFVAPRPRTSGSKPDFIAKTESVMSAGPSRAEKAVSTPTSKNGIGGRNVRLRMIPSTIASKWGSPTLPAEVAGLVGEGTVCLCSFTTLEKVQRTLVYKRDSASFVKITLEERKTLESPSGSSDSNGVNKDNNGEEIEVDQKEIEAWLTVWDELPEGVVVVSGKVSDAWNHYGTVRLSTAIPKKRRKSKTSLGSLPIDFPKPLSTRRLAGVDGIVDEAVDYLRRSALEKGSKPIVLVGAKGSGKTSIVKLVAEKLEADRDILSETLYYDVGRVDTEGRVTAIKEQISEWLEEATRRIPCLMILDNLDVLLTPENELTSSSNPAILADHFCRLFAPSSIPPGVMVLATTSTGNSLHSLLRTKHIFGHTVKIPIPTKEVRRDILRTVVEEQNVQYNPKKSISPLRLDINEVDDKAPALDYVTLASMTEGYSASDMNDLVSGATQQAMIRCSKLQENIQLRLDDFICAQQAFTPLSLRGVSLQKSDVRWDDIGGLHETRRILRETLEWPTKYAQIFANCPLRLRSGLLLYGFPGCGKTLLASAVAKECGLNFISVKGPEILNKYIGASEKSVRDLFERASAAKPCVLFFDEFDSIAPKRGHDSTGVTDRVVNQMLTEMDGAQGLDGVYVLAATSRPDLIDPALLRPGRLDKSLLCDMPNGQERLEILQAVSRKLTLGDSVNLESYIEQTDGFSGADLQALIYNAHLEVVHASIAESAAAAMTSSSSSMTNGKSDRKGKGKAVEEVSEPIKNRLSYRQIAPLENGDGGTVSDRTNLTNRINAILQNEERNSPETRETRKESRKPVIEDTHILRSLATTKPSVSRKDRAKLEMIYQSFVADRDGSLRSGEGGRSTGSRVSLM